MYRYLLFLLCHAASPAPPAMSDSDITYVKIQPPVETPPASSHYRESRIENLPLTIPGNVTFENPIKDKENKTEVIKVQSDSKSSDVENSDITLPESEKESIFEDPNLKDNENKTDARNVQSDSGNSDVANSDITLPESSNLSESIALPENETIAEPETLSQESAKRTGSEEIAFTDAVPTADENVQVLPERRNKPDSKERDELLEAYGSDLADTVPSETLQSERRGRTYDSSDTTDIFEEATERYDITEIPEFELRTKATPKFVPKLSYFQKPQGFVSFPTNSIEKTPRRRFRSHCRCEKIWNCPKLQISVPRCPNEYFLCCF